jgi:hypothetical protein
MPKRLQPKPPKNEESTVELIASNTTSNLHRSISLRHGSQAMSTSFRHQQNSIGGSPGFSQCKPYQWDFKNILDILLITSVERQLLETALPTHTLSVPQSRSCSTSMPTSTSTSPAANISDEDLPPTPRPVEELNQSERQDRGRKRDRIESGMWGSNIAGIVIPFFDDSESNASEEERRIHEEVRSKRRKKDHDAFSTESGRTEAAPVLPP